MSFDELARAQIDRFFGDVLPRYIDRHYRGRGYALVAAMLRDLDADDFAGVLAGPAPSDKARRRAGRFRERCPVRVVENSALHGYPPSVLGMFSHHWTMQYDSPVTARTVADDRCVFLYENAFRALASTDRDRVEHELLHTIIHEYVHALESYLPLPDQTLTLREQVPELAQLPPLSEPEARRKDTWYTVVWWGRPLVAVGFLAGLIGLLLLLTDL